MALSANCELLWGTFVSDRWFDRLDVRQEIEQNWKSYKYNIFVGSFEIVHIYLYISMYTYIYCWRTHRAWIWTKTSDVDHTRVAGKPPVVDQDHGFGKHAGCRPQPWWSWKNHWTSANTIDSEKKRTTITNTELDKTTDVARKMDLQSKGLATPHVRAWICNA